MLRIPCRCNMNQVRRRREKKRRKISANCSKFEMTSFRQDRSSRMLFSNVFVYTLHRALIPCAADVGKAAKITFIGCFLLLRPVWQCRILCRILSIVTSGKKRKSLRICGHMCAGDEEMNDGKKNCAPHNMFTALSLTFLMNCSNEREKNSTFFT